MVKKGTCGLCQGGCAVVYAIENGKIVNKLLRIIQQISLLNATLNCLQKEKIWAVLAGTAIGSELSRKKASGCMKDRTQKAS